jgi:hypothetical protein
MRGATAAGCIRVGTLRIDPVSRVLLCGQAYSFLLFPLHSQLELGSVVPVEAVVGVVMTVVLGSYLSWVLSAIRQITHALGIYCLKLGKRPQA